MLLVCYCSHLVWKTPPDSASRMRQSRCLCIIHYVVDVCVVSLFVKACFLFPSQAQSLGVVRARSCYWVVSTRSVRFPFCALFLGPFRHCLHWPESSVPQCWNESDLFMATATERQFYVSQECVWSNDKHITTRSSYITALYNAWGENSNRRVMFISYSISGCGLVRCWRDLSNIEGNVHELNSLKQTYSCCFS